MQKESRKHCVRKDESEGFQRFVWNSAVRQDCAPVIPNKGGPNYLNVFLSHFTVRITFVNGDALS